MERYRIVYRGIWDNKLQWLPKVLSYTIVHGTCATDAIRKFRRFNLESEIVDVDYWGPAIKGFETQQHHIVWMLKDFRQFLLYGDGSFLNAGLSKSERERYYVAARHVAPLGQVLMVTGYERFARCEATQVLGNCLAYHFTKPDNKLKK